MYATDKLFWDVGFSGILTNKAIGFKSSPYAAVDNACPGVFTKEELDKHSAMIDLPSKGLIKRRS